MIHTTFRRFAFAVFAVLLGIASASANPADDYDAGIAALKSGEHEVAIEKLTAAIESNALNERSLTASFLARGTAYRFAGKPKEAAADFEKVTALDPDKPDAWLYLGDARLQSGDANGALADLEQAVALDPGNGFAHMIRGDALYALEKWQRARADYDAAISRAPDLAAAFLGRARSLEKLENPEAALADYRTALELDPKLSAARIAIARLEAAVSD